MEKEKCFEVYGVEFVVKGLSREMIVKIASASGWRYKGGSRHCTFMREFSAPKYLTLRQSVGILSGISDFYGKHASSLGAVYLGSGFINKKPPVGKNKDMGGRG